MSIAGLQGKAYTDPDAPEAPGICDRSGFKVLHKDLAFQYDYRGNNLLNLRILVRPEDYDEPFEFNKPIILPPDPVPIQDPRPGFYASQEGPAPNPNFDSVLAQLVD